MTMRAHGCPAIFLIALGLAFGCAATRPDASVPLVQADPEAIATLPDYHAELVEAPVFQGQVFVLEAGPVNAPRLVLVHGLGDSGARDWYPILPALAQRFRVLTFDLPGFGRSTHGHALYAPERYADLIFALTRTRTHDRFHLVGHSMGGAIAIAYAAKYPATLHRLVLLDAAGILHRKAYVNFAAFAGLDNVLGILSGPAKELANAAMEATDPLLLGASDPSILLNNEALRTTVLGTPTRIAALAVILENFAPAIAAIRAPSWIWWGGKDTVASLRAGRVLAARLPHGRLRVQPEAGHDPMQDTPAALTAYLLEALTVPAEGQPDPGAADHASPAADNAPVTSPRTGRCHDETGVRFEGDYEAIDVERCNEVVLAKVRARSVRLIDSFVTVEDSQVTSMKTALLVKGSRVQVTASDFTGEVALECQRSDLDLAGVNLRGRKAAIHVVDNSKLVVSVSRIDSPNNHRDLHDVLTFDLGADL